MFGGLLPPVSKNLMEPQEPETLPHVNGVTVSEYYGLAAPIRGIGDQPAYPPLPEEATMGSGVAHVATYPLT